MTASSAAALVRVEECDSTQRLARALLDKGDAAPGSWIVAGHQTGGRGRLGRTWLPPAQGLYASLVWAARCPPAHAPRLTLGAAVGLHRALASLGITASVKWPNDLVIAGTPPGRLGPFRKVAGLLVEVASTAPPPSDRVDVVILGVGVNIKGPASGWPSELATTAGALADVGFSGTTDDVLGAVMRDVPAALTESLADFPATLRALEQHSATLHRRVEVADEGETRVGEAVALAPDGALVIRTDDGAHHLVRAGDVWLATP